MSSLNPMNPLDQACSQAITQHKPALAAALVEREFARHPELVARYGAIAREKSLQDAGYHLDCLAQAVAAGNPALFADYVGWAKVVLARRGVLAADFAFHLECMDEALVTVLAAFLPEDGLAPARAIIAHGLRLLPLLPDDLPSLIDAGEPNAALAHQYLQALLRSERATASRLILDAADAGIGVKALYLNVFQRTQYEIGRLWQTNHISVAQEHYCTAATQLIMSQLYPRIFGSEKNGRSFVGACVSGNLHEIGVRMVADFFEMEGWDTHYLGASTPAEGIIQLLVSRQIDVLGISATLPGHLDEVAALIRRVRAAPGCEKLIVLVGGYPFNIDRALWEKVGADGHGSDAAVAISLAAQLTARSEVRV